VELTGLERMVVLTSHVLCRKPLLPTNRKLQLQLQRQHRLLLMQLQVRLPVCRHILLNSGILQLNIQVEHQVRTITLLRAVQTSVKKITELVNKDLFSNQNVTLLMRRQKPNSGQRSERRLTPQSAVAECLMPKNF
jgi:Tfp pilus assembly protein PilN